jgi:hypothetical protein
MTLKVFENLYAVCRFPIDTAVPSWTESGEFVSVTRTPDEISVVCEQSSVPGVVDAERDWRLLRIEGQIEFSKTGIISTIVQPLATAGISVFTIATFNTDYVLVKEAKLQAAVLVLKSVGFHVISSVA